MQIEWSEGEVLKFAGVGTEAGEGPASVWVRESMVEDGGKEGARQCSAPTVLLTPKLYARSTIDTALRISQQVMCFDRTSATSPMSMLITMAAANADCFGW